MYKTAVYTRGYDDVESDTSKTAKIMNGDITPAIRHLCQRAAQVRSPIYSLISSNITIHDFCCFRYVTFCMLSL